MKTIIYTAIGALFLISCSTKKLNQSIGKYYPYYEEYATADSSDLVVVKPNEKYIAAPQSSYVRQVKNVFIPAIVFWKWNRLYKCELDKKQELQKLCSDIKADCYKYKLDSVLPDQKLELTIEAIPTSFAYQDKGFTFIYLYGYFNKHAKITFPILKENLVVAYKLYSKHNLIKEGTISIADNRMGVSDANSSASSMVDSYVILSRDNIYKAKKEFITKLRNVILQ